MSSDASNDFFWHDNSSDMQLQKISLDNFVLQEDQSHSVHVHLQEESLSPIMVQNSSEMDSNHSPGTEHQPLLPPGIINPDAIIPQTRSYTCRICQLTFPNKSAVTVHSKSHNNHDGKPYLCSFCKKGFSTNFYLKQHERIHNGQKPYKCPMCDTSFKQLSHVQQHVRTHTGVRPYKCHWQGCGKAFLQQSHLKSHVARHTSKSEDGARQYKCHWLDCGKSFAQISNLKSHIARHNPKPPKRRRDSAVKQELQANQANPEMPDTPNTIEGGAFGLVPASPDVIGQAAAAADIVPATAADCESICPFLCPGCSKLYVREATFKKHLEECKMKLQQSISATAAALGIEPPPLPPPNGQIPFTVVDMPSLDAMNHGSSEPQSKKRRKGLKPQHASTAAGGHTQQQVSIAVDMPLGVNLGGPQLCDVKQEELTTPTSNILFKLPQHILVDTEAADAESNVNSYFSTVPYNHEIGSSLFSNQHLTTSSPVNLQTVVSPAMVSSQTVMMSNSEVFVKSTAPARTAASTTINPAALNWQWNQPAPKMDFP